MKSYCRKSLIFAGLLAAVFAVFTGCAHTVPVRTNPPLPTIDDKIPLNMGLYVSEELRNYKVSEYKMGDQWNYTNLGMASASQFKLYLNQRFFSVEVVNQKPPFLDENKTNLHAVLEPLIDQFDFDIPFTKFQVYPAKIRYMIKVYDVKGNIILKEEVEGIGDTQGHPGYDFTTNPSKSASKAVEDGVQKAVEKMVSSDKLMRLLEYGDIRNAQAGKAELASTQISPNPINTSNTSLSDIEVEKKRIADEEAQIARLRLELEQLKAESGEGGKTEKLQLASIAKEVMKEKVSCAKKPGELSEQDIKNMLLKYHFFDNQRHPIGSFANEFVDNQNYTITDRATGLMWQKRGSFNYSDNRGAKRFIKQLNKKRFAGYSDWRMPTLEELASLLEKNNKSGAHIDPIFDRRQKQCWCSDIRAEYDQGHYGGWIVNFYEGSIMPSKTSSDEFMRAGWGRPFNDKNYVRAVRSLRK